MSNKKFLAVSIPIISIVAVLLIVLNILANIFDEFIDKYNPWGGNPYDTIQAEGTENWDTDYYEQKYSTKEEATKAGEDFVTRLGDEGIVLLKNKDNALPLSGENTIALMGRYSADPVYGGSGSGTVDAATAVNFKRGIENAGLKVNDTYYKETSSLYGKYDKADIIMDDPAKSTYYIGEIPLSAYSNAAKDSVKGQTAVIVLGRGGGEGGDLATNLKATLDGSTGMKANGETANYEDGQHQLELNKEEKELINFAKQNCSKTIVVLNSSTTMEVGLLESGEYEVDAILECGSIGATAANSLGNVIAGKVNPSGKTVDTWAADFTKMPSFMNTVDGRYTNISNYYGGTAYFVEYEEGIYVGYRYYETAYAEAMAGNYPGFEYDKEVVYPFGYGLSYTSFEKTLDSVTLHGDMVEVKVTVKNTGSAPGKDVVEIYYSAPYVKGGTEKSAVVLGGFAKTKQLDAGESESVAIEYAVRDMASYDSSAGGYALDGGEYVVSLRKRFSQRHRRKKPQYFRTNLYYGQRDGKRYIESVRRYYGIYEKRSR